MGASSLTQTVLLPLFEDSDKPSWLGDVNGAMRKIDAAFAAKEAEINMLTSQVNALSARVTALAAATGHTNI